MASENPAGISPITLTSEAAILTHRLVKCGTAAKSCLPTTAITEVAIGVAMVAAATASQVTVQFGGIAKITAQAAIAAGAEVMPYAASGTAADQGKCVTASGATAVAVGVALTAAAADGDVIEVLLSVPNVRGPLNA